MYKFLLNHFERFVIVLYCNVATIYICMKFL